MTRQFRIATLVGCCLTASLLSFGLIASGFQGNRGGGHPSGARPGGGDARPGGGGHLPGGGTIHAPARGGHFQKPSFQGQPPSLHPTPALSTPRLGGFKPPAGFPRTAQPPIGKPRTDTGSGRPLLGQLPGQGQPGQVQTTPGLPRVGMPRSDVPRGGTLPRTNIGSGENRNFGGINLNRAPRGGNVGIGLVNQSLGGNTFHLGTRDISLAGNHYRPAYARHSFYHGYWNGHHGHGGGYGGPFGYDGYGGYGGYRYYRPLGWGLGAWGLGVLAYNSGYLGYNNPYYVQSTGYNYSQPIPVLMNAPVDTSAAPSDGLDAAIAAFRLNDYDGALDLVNRAIAQTPTDAVLHEFRALVLFAKGDYQQSAATIHSVLAVGPGWNWTTLSSLYANAADYTPQLRALEAVVRNQPQDGATRFLLAYHYMTGGSNDAAARQLQQVVKLMPNDRVAADLLKMISPLPTQSPGEPALPPAAPAAAAIDPSTLLGTWTAQRDDGAQFILTLAPTATFNWKFTAKDQPAQDLKGQYTIEGRVLALQGSDGGSLIATVTPGKDGAFNFKLLQSSEEDPGLNFTR